eukprot:CAMPEP_0119572508 /NCGR_PEP_ID=MMETSP1352-20130426/44656_1 /TAXON_ID=265584 /ORGANISM="Stauroneis constricta, Strain CCMP1120" /LENGTH=600 /DNA_ID=CAMNT_0007622193 /DNA_START=27 /DNA_END=1829 /DNA_ORIENTATION=+
MILQQKSRRRRNQAPPLPQVHSNDNDNNKSTTNAWKNGNKKKTPSSWLSSLLTVQQHRRVSQVLHSSRELQLIAAFLLIVMRLCFNHGSLFYSRHSKLAYRSLRPVDDADAMYIDVSIPMLDLSKKEGDLGGWMLPSNLYLPDELYDKERAKRPNYGELDIQHSDNFMREINPADDRRYEKYREACLPDKRPHVATEYVRNEDLADREPGECRRVSWIHDYSPNCNALHEFDLSLDYKSEQQGLGDEQIYDSFYISHGYFRDAWVVESMPEIEHVRSVLKMTRYKYDIKTSTLDVALRDALIMEKLDGAPQIVNIYGHCGNAVWVEAMPYEVEEYIVPGEGYAKQKELDKEGELRPRNHFTVTEKLTMAFEMAESLAVLHGFRYVVPGEGYATQEELDKEGELRSRNHFTVTEKLTMAFEMAESLAVLHGFRDGLIIHDDVQLCQWLRLENGKLKLGDFNRAEIPAYNATSGQYCKYQNGEVFGNYRSPEEFADLPLTEGLDMFSFGNNIYALLTGLWVFYENSDDEVVHKKLIEGEIAYIDPRYEQRSYGEKKLVEILRRCWEYNPEKRINIFQAVEMLREAVKENAKLEAAAAKHGKK